MAVTTLRRDPHTIWLSQQLEDCKQQRVAMERDIQKLQRQVEILSAREQAFKEALEDHQRNVPAVMTSVPPAARPKAVRRTVKGGVGGKFGVILDHVAQAGARGLTVSEMYELAERSKLGIKRNTLRSQLWHRKQDGKLELIDGYYRIPQRSEGTPSTDKAEGPDEPEPSDPSDHFEGAA